MIYFAGARAPRSRARALVPWQYSCCVLRFYLVAILLACHPLTIPYLVCVDAATARARSLTRTVFSEEQKITHSLNDAPQSTICLLYYKWYILPVHVPPTGARAHWYLDKLCVALLSGCYFACVSSSYHPVSGLRRCCHRTGAQSHENGIFRGTKNHP